MRDAEERDKRDKHAYLITHQKLTETNNMTVSCDENTGNGAART